MVSSTHDESPLGFPSPTPAHRGATLGNHLIIKMKPKLWLFCENRGLDNADETAYIRFKRI